MIVGLEASTILESVIGRPSHHYYVYVLPEFGGFQLVVHHDNSISSLTDDQQRQFVDLVDKRLKEVTNPSSNKEPTK